jgi:hypothetical protein
LTELLATRGLVKQRRDEARMSFVGSHKVKSLLVNVVYLGLILFSVNQFLICKFSPCVITTFAPFHFGSTFFFFRSWSLYCNFVLEWLKAKYLAKSTQRLVNSKNSKIVWGKFLKKDQSLRGSEIVSLFVFF